MDKNTTIQEIHKCCKKFDEIRCLDKKTRYNNSESLMVKKIIEANAGGERLISSELAKRLGVTRSAISQMVKKLEENGTLRRVPDKFDKKIAYIELSDDALKIYECMRDETEYLYSQLIERIGEQEVADFLHTANRFLDVVEEIKSEYAEGKERNFNKQTSTPPRNIM